MRKLAIIICVLACMLSTTSGWSQVRPTEVLRTMIIALQVYYITEKSYPMSFEDLTSARPPYLPEYLLVSDTYTFEYENKDDDFAVTAIPKSGKGYYLFIDKNEEIRSMKGHPADQDSPVHFDQGH